MFNPMSWTLPRFLTVVVGIASVSAGAALAQGWTPVGPSGVGMVTVLSAGSSELYAATSNGVYRSDDHGVSWREAGLQRESIVRLAVDPRSDTIYAALHSHDWIPPYPAPQPIAPSTLSDPLWVSRDGGETWTQTALAGVTAVAVDLSQPDTAYVAVFFGPLQVTHDSGATWSQLPEYPADAASQLAVDGRDGTIYAAFSGLFVGAQGVWTNPVSNIRAVAFASGSDDTVYAAGDQQFCRKTKGSPWTCNAFPGFGPSSILELPGSQSAVARILVAGSNGIWSSDDSGKTWSPDAGGPAGNTQALALHPSGSPVFAGNDVGMYRSTDRGDTWTNSSSGLRATWSRSLVLGPSDPATIWSGVESNAQEAVNDGPGLLLRTTGDGASWIGVYGGGQASVSAIAIAPSDPLKIYAGSHGSVSHSDDGGASWSVSSLGGFFVFALAVDPQSSSTVWAATSGSAGLSKSSDSGQSWTKSVAHDVYCLLFDPRKPGRIYAGSDWEDGGSYYPFGFGGSVYTSSNGGTTWSRTKTDLGASVLSLAVDPFSEDVVYAGTDAGTILRSHDAGATWEQWNTDTAGYMVLALVADPVRPGRLYAGGWNGVFRSVDGGRNWESFSDGLSPLEALGLAVSPDGRWLYVGTGGGGLYRRDLALVVADRPPVTTVDRPRTPRDFGPRPP